MITPSDSPSSPEHYAAVAVSGTDIQAGNDVAAVQAAFDGAVAVSASGVLYPKSPRQADTESLIMSPPGYEDFDIYGGFSGQGTTTHGWPNDVGPADGD